MRTRKFSAFVVTALALSSFAVAACDDDDDGVDDEIEEDIEGGVDSLEDEVEEGVDDLTGTDAPETSDDSSTTTGG